MMVSPEKQCIEFTSFFSSRFGICVDKFSTVFGVCVRELGSVVLLSRDQQSPSCNLVNLGLIARLL